MPITLTYFIITRSLSTLADMRKIPEKLEILADQDSRPIEIFGFKGRRKDWVEEELLKDLFEPRPIGSLHTSARFIYFKRKSDKGSWVYRTRWDLGEGPQNYFVKVISEARVFRVMRERMKTKRGILRPWRYPRKIIMHLLDQPESRISWVTAAALHTKGVLTPEPVAYFHRRLSLLRDEFFITKEVESLQESDLRNYFRECLSRAEGSDWINEKRSLIIELAEFFQRVMESEIYFPDLKMHNLLLQKAADGAFRFFITDTNEAVFRAPEELVMLDHFNRNPGNSDIITDLDRIRFIKAYLACRNDDRDWREICRSLSKRPTKRREKTDKKRRR